MMILIFVVVHFLSMISILNGLTKVIVPAVYKEWNPAAPYWYQQREHQRMNYSIFLYQKLHKNKDNYIETNRGAEGAVYLKYIVDHYHKFPDIAIFVHAYPDQHQRKWLKMINCIKPKATYMNINFQNMCGSTSEWYQLSA